MSERVSSLVLLVAGLLFALFVLSKILPLPGRNRATAEARKRLSEIKARAADRSRPAAERAAALREAATLALGELRRPGLAASLARRAERVEPGSAEGLGLLATALRRQSRYRALERLLWQRLTDAPPEALERRALHELIQLYEGALDRPEIAAALRRWPRQGSGGPSAGA
jgi:hypothetical protein